MSGTKTRSKYVPENIRKYNSCFQITSFCVSNGICESGFMPTFKIQGQVYPCVGSLLPLSVGQHKLLQIYFVGDEQRKVRQRCSNIPGTHPHIVTELQRMLHQHNTYVHIFKTALQTIPSDAYKVGHPCGQKTR
jgi:hypothetical protein